MTGEPRQPSYVDLSDGQVVCFGGACGMCGARYASRPLPIQGATGATLRDLRKSALSQFDVAWRDLQVSCHRCSRGACPECWDVESRMCVECADARGLARAAYAPPTRGPLADGRLVLLERGKYSRVEQPAWVGDLIALRRSNGPQAGEAGLGGAMNVEPRMLAPTTTGDLAREVYPDALLVPVPANSLAGGPMEQIPATPHTQPLPPPVLPPFEGDYSRSPVGVPRGSGPASAGMIACPRCGTANYDFVTQCTSCQLQLIQICPNCEKLNPGRATRCESCGSLLARPRGWSGVLPPLSADFIEAVEHDTNAKGPANAAPAAPQGARQAAAEAAAAVRTRVVPYVPNARTMITSAATYTPGGLAAPAARSPLPERERGKRRRPSLTADVGSAASAVAASGQGQAVLSQPQFVVQPVGLVAKAGALIDRIAGWLLALVVLGFVGMIAAAEISPGANAVLRGIIHIDIRQTLAQFAGQIQVLWQHIHH